MMTRNYNERLDFAPRCSCCDVEMRPFYKGRFCRRCLITVGAKGLAANGIEPALTG